MNYFILFFLYMSFIVRSFTHIDEVPIFFSIIQLYVFRCGRAFFLIQSFPLLLQKERSCMECISQKLGRKCFCSFSHSEGGIQKPETANRYVAIFSKVLHLQGLYLSWNSLGNSNSLPKKL